MSSHSSMPVISPSDPSSANDAASDPLIGTCHLQADLKGRAVRGGSITLLTQSVKLFIQLLATAVLARALSVDDFGLVAMCSVVTGFIALFNDLGLSSATVQKVRLANDQINVLFWLNVGLGITLAIATVAISPLVALFYGEPRVWPITACLGLAFIFVAFSAQQTALLRREMRFKALAAIDLSGLIAGNTVAIVLAQVGVGYWALVFLVLTQAITALALTWSLSAWRPSRPARAAGVRGMLAFGANLTGFNVLNFLNRNADNLLLGYTGGPAVLGLYSKAYSLLMLPIRQINGPVSAVVLPALSRLQESPDHFRSFFLRAVEALALVSLPIAAFALVATRDIVLLFLGSQWEGVVPIFQYLAPGAVVGTLNVTPGWILISLGRTDRLLRWSLFSTPITLIGFLIGIQWGAEGVAIAFTGTYSLLFVGLLCYAVRGSPVSVQSYFRTLMAPLLSAATAVGVAFGVSSNVEMPSTSAGRLLVYFVCFGASYLATCLLFPSVRRLALNVCRALSERRSSM